MWWSSSPAWVLFAAHLTFSSEARGQESVAGEAPTGVVNAPLRAASASDEAPERWYGWQLLIFDTAAIAGGVAVGLAQSWDYGLFVGVAGLALPPIFVHAVNESEAGLYRGLGLRWGVPLLGAAMPPIYAALAESSPKLEAWHIGAGASAGAILGAVLDVAFASVPLPSSPTQRGSVVVVVPNPSGLSIAGQF